MSLYVSECRVSYVGLHQYWVLLWFQHSQFTQTKGIQEAHVEVGTRLDKMAFNVGKQAYITDLLKEDLAQLK